MESANSQPEEKTRNNTPSHRATTVDAKSERARLLTFGPIVLAAVIPAVLFLAVLHNPGYPIAQDTPTYAIPGSNFWHGAGYGVHDSTGRFVPEMDRAPVYPLLIGPFYTEGSSWYWPVLVAQAILRALMAWLLLHLPGWRRSPVLARAGCLSAWLVALDATAALLAVRVVTETLSAFLLLLTVWCVLTWRETRNRLWIAAAGAVAGLNVLTRPINVIAAFLLLIVVCCIYVRRSNRAERRWWIGLAAFLLALAVFPAIWMARNASYSGRPILSLVTSKTLYLYRAAYVESVLTGRSLEAAQRELAEAEQSEFAGRKAMPWETAQWRSARAREILLDHPIITLRGAVAGLFRAVVGPGVETWKDLVRIHDRTSAAPSQAPSAATPVPRWVFLPIGWSLVHLLVLYIAVAAGLLRAIRRRHLPFTMGLSLLLAAGLILAAAGPEAYSRFRIPVMPLLALAAGIGIFFPAPSTRASGEYTPHPPLRGGPRH